MGHLGGWGRGLGQGADTPMFMRSAGNDHRRTLTWLVTGRGRITLRVDSPRVGTITEHLAIGDGG